MGGDLKVLLPVIVLFFLLFACRKDVLTSPEEGQGSITIASLPQGADIFINNQSTNSKTPQNFENVSSGQYSVTLSYLGFSDTTIVVSVESGKRKIINVSLVLEN